MNKEEVARKGMIDIKTSFPKYFYFSFWKTTSKHLSSE